MKFDQLRSLEAPRGKPCKATKASGGFLVISVKLIPVATEGGVGFEADIIAFTRPKAAGVMCCSQHMAKIGAAKRETPERILGKDC